MSTHGGYVRGEWWLTQDGEVLYADQDIGEQGHEAIAIEHMIDWQCAIDALMEAGLIDESDANEMEHGYGSHLFFEMKWPDSIGRACVKTPEIWDMIKRGQAREAFVQFYGAIMVVGGAFFAWKITSKTIEAIQNFIEEEYVNENTSDLEIWIEGLYPKKSTIIPWSDFQFVTKPSELLWSRP